MSQVTIRSTSSKGLSKKALSVMRKSSFVRRANLALRRSSSLGTTSLTVRPGRGLAGAQILPDRLNTVFESTGSFYIPAGNMAAAAGNYMNMVANSIYQPFQGGYPVTTAVNAYSMHGAWAQGYTGLQNPIGYNGIANLYSLYKVKKVIVEFCIQPQSSGDTTQAVAFPIGSEAIPSAAAGSVNLQVMLGQPRNKTVVAAAGATAKYQTIRIQEFIHDILGRRKAQWNDEASTAIGSQPVAADQAFVGLFLQSLDGATNASPVVVSVRMWQHVELTDLIQQIN